MNKREFLVISVCIFMTIAAWVVADIYHTQSQETTDTSVTVPAVKSISVNKQVLESIRMRR